MAFQILNNEGITLDFNVLDQESIELFGTETDSDNYQLTGAAGSWYQVIGGAIERPGNYTSGWDNVKVDIYSLFTKKLVFMTSEEQIERLKYLNAILAPYFTLINKWSKQGYKPVKI